MTTVLGRDLPGTAPIGESWEVFDRDGDSSRIANGRLAGQHLADVRGDEPFPLLVKLLDASGPLSVQVHPGVDAARRFGGEPKAECWFVLQADPGAHVVRGLRDGCDETELRRALAAGDVSRCLHTFDVSAGDVVFLPPGTVHSIGGGVLLAEVQENSDTTYRLHDWERSDLDGRTRPLHVEQALASIRWNDRGDDRVRAQIVDDGPVTRLLLVQSRWFTVDHVTAMGTFTLEVEPSPACSYAVLHVLSGSGRITPFHRHVAPEPFAPGDTLLLPEEFDAYELEPGATVLRALLFRR
jgi:mannose-6-phosphate isomerase